MAATTISTFQFAEMFPDAEAARLYLESRLWPNGPVCPVCSSGEHVATLDRVGYYRCNACRTRGVDEVFTVRSGTIFERSKIPLHKWLYAMYLLLTARKSVSSLQMSKELGITQKSAWFMIHRIREACGEDLPDPPLSGTVEIDECYIGGKEAAKHESKKLKLGRGAVGKTAVLGMRERGGRTVAMPIPDTEGGTLKTAIYAYIAPGSTLNTDEAAAYGDMDGLFFRHQTVNHGAGEYARGPVTTNGIESVWALLKRGIHGTFHHISPKHTGRYINEFTFRLNDGNVRRDTRDRLNSLIAGVANKRLTCKALVAK